MPKESVIHLVCLEDRQCWLDTSVSHMSCVKRQVFLVETKDVVCVVKSGEMRILVLGLVPGGGSRFVAPASGREGRDAEMSPELFAKDHPLQNELQATKV